MATNELSKIIANKTPSVLYTTSERWSLLAPFPGQNW